MHIMSTFLQINSSNTRWQLDKTAYILSTSLLDFMGYYDCVYGGQDNRTLGMATTAITALIVTVAHTHTHTHTQYGVVTGCDWLVTMLLLRVLLKLNSAVVRVSKQHMFCAVPSTQILAREDEIVYSWVGYWHVTNVIRIYDTSPLV